MKEHMRQGAGRILRRSAALGVVIASVSATTALASTPTLGTGVTVAPLIVDGQLCTPSVSGEALAWQGDDNDYTMVQGELPDNVLGTGWTLSHGASLVPTQLADGGIGSVLNLPSGSTAVTSSICINNSFTEARLLTRDLAGSGGVSVSVQTWTGSGWGAVQASSQVTGSTGWSLSNELPINPVASGWEVVRFVFAEATGSNESQLYDLWVDPRVMPK